MILDSTNVLSRDGERAEVELAHGNVAVVKGYGASSAGLATSATLLKEIGEMTGKLPYLKGVAGILLRIIEISDQIVVYRERWDEVLEVLDRIAQVVTAARRYCEGKRFHAETDLPADLRSVLSRMTVDLNEVRDVLEQCTAPPKWGHMKLGIIRSEMLRKIDQCDRKLKTLLDVCNTSLLMNIQVNQTSGPQTKLYNLLTSIANALPSEPQVFHGRQKQLNAIISSILVDVQSAAARIAIMGPGGMGKTALALAVLHNPLIKDNFKSARLFVACDACTSLAHLLGIIAEIIGIHSGSTASLKKRILFSLASLPKCIICFDNLETPWEGDTIAVETFLSELSGLASVTVLITMRGTARPGDIIWTTPLLPPLHALEFDAAKQIFTDISGCWNKWADLLVTTVECVPLAVTLLAHLAQTVSVEQLWTKWEQDHVMSIEREKGHRLTSLEFSIYLSINSGRMQSNSTACALLSILSILPGGLNMKKTLQFQELFNCMPEIEASISTLEKCSLAHYSHSGILHAHALIRYYCLEHHPPLPVHKLILKDYFIELIKMDNKEHRNLSYDQISERGNIISILSLYLKDKYLEHQVVEASIAFSKIMSMAGQFSDTLLKILNDQRHQLLYDIQHEILIIWGTALLEDNRISDAKKKFLTALSLAQNKNSQLGKGKAYEGLGQTYCDHGDLDKATECFQYAYHMYIKAQDAKGMSGALDGLGKICLKNYEFKKAKQHIYQSMQHSQESNSPLCLANNWQTLGSICIHEGSLQKAKTCLTKALEIYKQQHYVAGVSSTLCLLGGVCQEQNELQKAKVYYYQAIKLDEIANKLDSRGHAFDKLGDIFFDDDHIEGAVCCYSIAFNYYTKGDTSAQTRYTCLRSFVRAYQAQGQLDNAIYCALKACALHEQLHHKYKQHQFDWEVLADLYDEQGHRRAAANCLHNSFDMQEIFKDDYEKAITLILLGYAYWGMREYSRAEKFWQECVDISVQAGYLAVEGDAWQGLSYLYAEISTIHKAMQCCIQAVDRFKQAKEHKREQASLYKLAELHEYKNQYGPASQYRLLAAELDVMVASEEQ